MKVVVEVAHNIAVEVAHGSGIMSICHFPYCPEKPFFCAFRIGAAQSKPSFYSWRYKIYPVCPCTGRRKHRVVELLLWDMVSALAACPRGAGGCEW